MEDISLALSSYETESELKKDSWISKLGTQFNELLDFPCCGLEHCWSKGVRYACGAGNLWPSEDTPLERTLFERVNRKINF